MKLIKRSLTIGLLILAFGFLALGPQSPAQDEETGKFYVVEMYDFFFDPPGLFLQPGDRVAWIMLEDSLNDGHSASAYHPGNDKVLRVPEEAGAWSTPLVEALNGWGEYTFEAVGVHDYFCIPHETEGMVGRAIVSEPTGPGADETNKGISPAGISSLPTIEEIMGFGGPIFNAQGRINAVVFYVRQQSRQEARDALVTLIDEVEAGADQEDSLYTLLESVEQIEPFLEGLNELSDLLRPGISVGEIAEKAEDLKVILDLAYQELIMSRSEA